MDKQFWIEWLLMVEFGLCVALALHLIGKLEKNEKTRKIR
jgi:hypothetical protein